jgi:site-specific recombinase XerD
VATGPYTRRVPITPLPLADFRIYINGWIVDSEIQGHSPRTLDNRRLITSKLLWWLEREGVVEVGEAEMRGFFLYLRRGHEEPAGRWGRGEYAPLRPATAKWWHAYLSSLWASIAAQGAVEESPMLRIPAPRVPRDQIQPFTDEQVLALLAAAKRTRYHRRDPALILFLYDTGARAAEACSIRWGDVQLAARRVEVLGKGNKRRVLCFGQETAAALWSYARAVPREAGDPLFISERGAPLTVSGLRRAVKRLGAAAGLTGVRISPHTLRHSFSLAYVRAGADAIQLQQALGHEDLSMSRHYCAVGQADLARAHRSFSPADTLKRR